MLKRGLFRAGVIASSSIAVALVPTIARAQVSLDPTEKIEPLPTGWIGWLNVLILLSGFVVAALIALLYLRRAPRFRRAAQAEATVLRPGVRAPSLELGGVAARRPAPAPENAPPPTPVEGPTAAVAAPAPPAPAAPAAAAPAPAASAPPPAAPAADVPAPPADAPAPGADAPAAPAAAAPAPEAKPEAKKEAELDQETFDRVLAEQLDKGVDRRVAEGRAKGAAVKAARAKAEG